MTTPPKLCRECKERPLYKSRCCRQCHAVGLACGFVSTRWEREEYPELARIIRSCRNLYEFRDESKSKGAWMALKLATLLIQLRHISGMDERDFVRVVLMDLDRDRLEMEGIKRGEGLDAWRVRCDKFLDQAFEALTKR